MDRPERLLTPPFVFTIVAELGVFLTIGMLLPVLPVYAKDELGAGSIGIGIAVAAVSPTALLFQPLVGQLGDRRGRRLLVVSGPLVVAGTVASYTLASSLWALVGLRLLGGLGEALLYVGAATIVTDLAPADRRGEAMSLYSLGLWGGLALGPVLGEAVLGDARYDAVWGAKRAAGSALVLLTVGLLAIGLWNQPIGLYLGTSIFALGAALAFPALMTLAISGADDFDRSSVVGTFSACADVGFALGALTLGGVASLVGYDGVFLFSAGFAAFGMVVLARLPTHVPVRALEAA